jgi:uncharacterized protein (TIGR02271 family)
MERRGVREGLKVRSSDGKNLGKVVSCGADTFIIEKGFFFPKDFTARYEQVADLREDEIWLGEAGDQLMRGHLAQGGQAGVAGVSEEVRVPLAEEELTAEKRAVEAGEVRVRKDVKVEQKQVEVPVTKEEVHVERVPASGETLPEGAVFQEGTVSVPVVEEEVEVRKRPVVREEVRVSKTAHQEEERFSAETRKETAAIEEEGQTRKDASLDPDELKRT